MNINEQVETIIESAFMLGVVGINPNTVMNESTTSYGKYDVLIENALDIASLLEAVDTEPDAVGAKRTLWNKFTNVNWGEKMTKIKDTIKKIWKWITAPGRVLKDLITGKSTLKSIRDGIRKKRQEAKEAKNKDVERDLGKAEKDVDDMMNKTDEQIKKKGGESSSTSDDNGLTPWFFEKVKNGDLLSVRIMMKDSLLVDLSFKQFDAIVKATKGLDDLYVEHDGRDF